MTDYTFESYLDFDRENLRKSEFFRGEIRAMPGGTLKHSLLTTQLSASLFSCAKSKGCLISSPDARLYIPLCNLSAYPDMMMFCENPAFYDGKKDILLNPTVIAEVLSTSTERYDRETKFPCYVTIPSVSMILLVAQKTQEIEVYSRQTNWKKESYTEGEFEVEGCQVSVSFVYENTDF